LGGNVANLEDAIARPQPLVLIKMGDDTLVNILIRNEHFVCNTARNDGLDDDPGAMPSNNAETESIGFIRQMHNLNLNPIAGQLKNDKFGCF
jgi:hypothetical protein